MKNIQELSKIYEKDILDFAKKLISIKSLTCEEGELAKAVYEKMQELGFDKILISCLGDIVGVIGEGETKVLLDAHMDTVDAKDEKEWKYPPFKGVIEGDKLYGRGASDMKGAIAAIIYAGFFVKKLGLAKDKTLYISISVAEEDFDSVALASLINEFELLLDYAIICEPSDQKIALGHRGRAMIVVESYGLSAHGSAPQNGKNAVYEMQKIIKKVEELNLSLAKKEGERGSVALCKIESVSASLNAVPSKARIYLDRRLALHEDEEYIKKEMADLLASTNASWYILDAFSKSYTGKELKLHTFLNAWESKQDSHLAKTLAKAVSLQTKKDPVFFKWDFATNAFATTALNIPTIGFGPGCIKMCHMKDEYVNVKEIIAACAIYTKVVQEL